MKHKAEVIINAPREQVWAAFDDPDNMTRWQPTLESFVHKSGTPGHPGAVSELTYNENGRKIVMTETISERREEEFLAGIYESGFGTTTIVNNFEKINAQQTKWTMWCNFRFRGFMKIMALFMSKSIRKRTDEDLQRFKQLAEGGGS
ncbi:MAG: SRPBCC family protein [Woeseia sp.]|nr:SRPBCC family protein [Woeseia sp.]NNE59768.1 SRPBCC family protein [Woeseia sp.]NNL54665.1 SRPBCC family protein [Woeseia sp.]